MGSGIPVHLDPYRYTVPRQPVSVHSVLPPRTASPSGDQSTMTQEHTTLCCNGCNDRICSTRGLGILMTRCVCEVIVYSRHHLVGQVVKASASGVEDAGFESRLRRDFSGSSHTSDFNIGTGEVESLICNFYLNVVARKIVSADPSLR